ncbi:hypothetical protein M3Y95_00825100 [Aphelenchoides besseyi]|nr:hypothetical protein M3Y95_00825100 [Aphelenchoides besseyi]
MMFNLLISSTILFVLSTYLVEAQWYNPNGWNQQAYNQQYQAYWNQYWANYYNSGYYNNRNFYSPQQQPFYLRFVQYRPVYRPVYRPAQQQWNSNQVQQQFNQVQLPANFQSTPQPPTLPTQQQVEVSASAVRNELPDDMSTNQGFGENSVLNSIRKS